MPFPALPKAVFGFVEFHHSERENCDGVGGVESAGGDLLVFLRDWCWGWIGEGCGFGVLGYVFAREASASEPL